LNLPVRLISYGTVFFSHNKTVSAGLSAAETLSVWFINHGTVFFSHNKITSASLSAAETINQTERILLYRACLDRQFGAQSYCAESL
jgi:hypothetical protein